MLVEALVITACLQQQGGCSESTSAYYQYNKDVQILTKRVEDLGKQLVDGNEWLVYAATPMYAVAAGQPANFHIYKGLVFSVNVKREFAALQWSY